MSATQNAFLFARRRTNVSGSPCNRPLSRSMSSIWSRRLFAGKVLPAKQIVKFAPWMIARHCLNPTAFKAMNQIESAKNTGQNLSDSVSQIAICCSCGRVGAIVGIYCVVVLTREARCGAPHLTRIHDGSFLSFRIILKTSLKQRAPIRRTIVTASKPPSVMTLTRWKSAEAWKRCGMPRKLIIAI